MATVSSAPRSPTLASPWELAAETIAVKIRWFGLLVGYLLVNLLEHPADHRAILNAILTLGALYTLVDTYHSLHGRVFLGRYPLSVSLMEAVFIAFLCHYASGLESPFRYYYFLSLVCCAIRHSSHVTYASCALHFLSYGALYLLTPPEGRSTSTFAITLVVMGWVTWSSNALGLLLKQIGDYLGQLNAALRENQALLEERIDERTRQLQESQAHVLHQEKMAAFGLLAAGIAHEVGNPLTSISSLVQILQRREQDAYTLDKLGLVNGQLQRIRATLRELIEFSRPASSERTRVALGDILEEALNIAKYYKRTRGRIAVPPIPTDLPPLVGVRDQLVQVFLNLVLNAIDATDRDGRIELVVGRCPRGVEVAVKDNGSGIAPENSGRVFSPYFTTKKDGTGLGLFVTRKLVHDHGGDILFESLPGQGTVFRVTLPLTGGRDSCRAADPEPPALAGAGRLTTSP